jgi:hypothetical protein
MKLFPRYRRPSLKTVLGVTRAKKQLKRNLGMYDNPAWKVTHAVPNAKRRVGRRVGYYSGPAKFLRWLKH